MFFYSLFFFFLTEIYFLAGFKNFWLAVIFFFLFWAFRRLARPELKKFFILLMPVVFLVFNLGLHQIFSFKIFWAQFHFAILAVVFSACFIFTVGFLPNPIFSAVCRFWLPP